MKRLIFSLAVLAGLSGFAATGPKYIPNPITTNTPAVMTNVVQSIIGQTATNAAMGVVTYSNLPAANLTGTVADARLSTNVALLNGTNVFTGTNSFGSTTASNLTVASVTGDGSGFTNLNATLISQGTLVDARLSANAQSVVTNNVIAFGARGDGVTDDYLAIQTALNTLTNGGYTLKFPAGVYRITNDLILNMHRAVAGFSIEGEGRGNTVLSFIGANTRGLVLDSVDNSKIRGVSLWSVAPSTGAGLVFTNTCTHNSVESFSINNFATGILFAGDTNATPAEDFANEIKHGRVGNFTVGMDCVPGGSGLLAVGPAVEFAGGMTGIRYGGILLHIKESVIETTGVGIELVSTNSFYSAHQTTIEKCHFEDNTNADILISGGIAAPGISQLKITDNLFSNQGHSAAHNITNTGVSIDSFVWGNNLHGYIPAIVGAMQLTTNYQSGNWNITGEDLNTYWKFGTVLPTLDTHYVAGNRGYAVGILSSNFATSYALTLGNPDGGAVIGPDRNGVYPIGESTNRFGVGYLSGVDILSKSGLEVSARFAGGLTNGSGNIISAIAVGSSATDVPGRIGYLFYFEKTNDLNTSGLGFVNYGDNEESASIFLKRGGNVGINTVAPKSMLEIANMGGTTEPVGLGLPGGQFILDNEGIYGMLFGVSGSGAGWIQEQRMSGGATAYDLWLQPSGGNVGIGTTNPTNKLEIIGNVKSSGTVYADAISATNNATLGGSLTVSNMNQAAAVATVGVTAAGVLTTNMPYSWPTYTITSMTNVLNITNGVVQSITLTNPAQFTLSDYDTNNTETIRLEIIGSNQVTWVVGSLSNAAALTLSASGGTFLLDRNSKTNLWYGSKLR